MSVGDQVLFRKKYTATVKAVFSDDTLLLDWTCAPHPFFNGVFSFDDVEPGDVFRCFRCKAEVKAETVEVKYVPAEQLREAVGVMTTARNELRAAIRDGNPQVLREYAEDAVEALTAALGGR